MRLVEFSIQNYRRYCDITTFRVSSLTGAVGKNDAGKSTILKALSVYFNGKKMSTEDRCVFAVSDAPIVLIGKFEPYEGERKAKIPLDSNNLLVLKKTFREVGKAPNIEVCAYDYVEDELQNLRSKREADLNKTLDRIGIDYKKSGRSITNEEKISRIIEWAEKGYKEKIDVWIELDKDLMKEIELLLPEFIEFENEMELETDVKSFQSPFLIPISEQLNKHSDLTKSVVDTIRDLVNDMTLGIQRNLQDLVSLPGKLILEPGIEWKNAMSIRVSIEEQSGKPIGLSNHGTGQKRLVMVAYLKYMAEKDLKDNNVGNVIYAIEEPENSLHPGAQRILSNSLSQLADKGNQVIFSTHSPVFVAGLEQEQIILVTSEEGRSKVSFGDTLSQADIAAELGVLAQDNLLSYAGVLFVEGPTDVAYFLAASEALAKDGKLKGSLDEIGIGVIPCGGQTIQFFVDTKLLQKISRRFMVIIDSDVKQKGQTPAQKKLNLVEKVRELGGKGIILRKRAIENYLHPSACQRILKKTVVIDEYNEVKDEIGKNGNQSSHFNKIVRDMSPAEFLDRCEYTNDNGETAYEILEILQEAISLAIGE